MLERGEADYRGLIGEFESKDEEYCDDVQLCNSLY